MDLQRLQAWLFIYRRLQNTVGEPSPLISIDNLQLALSTTITQLHINPNQQ